MFRVFASVVIAGAVALGPQAVARDLWGDGGVILRGNQAAVLARVMRVSPETRLYSVVAISEPVLADITSDFVIGSGGVSTAGRALTAPPIPGRAPALMRVDPLLPDDAEGVLREDYVITQDTDETVITDAETAPERYIPGEVFFDFRPAVDPKALGLPDDGYEIAGLLGPGVTRPSSGEPATAPRPPPPQFDSGAFTGHYAGVGPASGMRLELEVVGHEISGSFVDSAGQIFLVVGEFGSVDGRAQAAVISASSAIGYFDFQLTNLGLGAMFVPLAEDMTPMVGAAREYEFLRALSPEAQAALDAGRAEREAEAESRDNVDPSTPHGFFPGADNLRD